MQGILIKGSTQTTEVMMLADTVELEILAIMPDAYISIALEITDASGGLQFITHINFH